jgi:eukaryotic-like serine/threonine-protein kinase
MNHPPLLPAGTLLAGKFRIERLLGAGAMGAVYAIDHELTRHKRALKLLHPEVRLVPDLVHRFLNEASAAGRAGNQHLVETFDAGTLPTGEPYVVMELLQGETLGSLLVRERVIGPARASDLIAQAAEGMHAAHRAGIIHRDIKPDNLFITLREGRPFVKILDFGVSKFSNVSAGQTRRTKAGMLYGSPAYMSPEQIMGMPDVDPRTDVFALGVVLFQCLTGVLPFDAPNIHALTARMLTGTPTPIETLRADLPLGLSDIVRYALATARTDRLPSARALADALAPFRPDALRMRGAEIARAALTRSDAPMVSSRNPPAGLPRRRNHVILLPLAVGAVTISIGLAATVRLVRSRGPAVAASPGLSSGPVTEVVALPAPTATFAETADLPPPLSSVEPAASIKVPSLAPPVASARSNAKSLGLSKENPFR